MKAHYPVKSSPIQAKRHMGFLLNMTLTMRSMACHLQPQKKQGKTPQTLMKNPAKITITLYSWESKGYTPSNVTLPPPTENLALRDHKNPPLIHFFLGLGP